MAAVSSPSQAVARLLDAAVNEKALGDESSIERCLFELSDHIVPQMAARFLLQNLCDLWQAQVGVRNSCKLLHEAQDMLMLDNTDTVRATELRTVVYKIRQQIDKNTMDVPKVHMFERPAAGDAPFEGYNLDDLSCITPLLNAIRDGEPNLNRDRRRANAFRGLQSETQSPTGDIRQTSGELRVLCSRMKLSVSLVKQVVDYLAQHQLLRAHQAGEINDQLSGEWMHFYDLANLLLKYLNRNKIKINTRAVISY